MPLLWPDSYQRIKDELYSQWEIKGEIEILREFTVVGESNVLKYRKERFCMDYFDYQTVATEARIPADKLEELRRIIRCEFPRDDMMYELHLL